MRKTHKYITIKNYIRQNVVDRKYDASGRIESENELAELFSVSRMTVRRAIKELQDENIVRTTKGKGTFVAKKPLEFDSAHLISYLDQAIISGFDYYVDILVFEAKEANSYMKEMFHLSDNDRIWELKRVHYFDKLPSIYEEVYIPVKYAKDLTYQHAINSIFNYLEKSGYNIEQSELEHDAVIANDMVMNALKIDAIPVTLRTHHNYDAKDELIEISRSFYHPDNYQSKVRLKRRRLNHAAHQVLLVCHEGIVSSNIELRLNQYAHHNSLNLVFHLSEPGSPKIDYADYSAILIEPRFRFIKNEIQATVPNLFVEVISMEDYSSFNEENILRSVRKQLDI